MNDLELTREEALTLARSKEFRDSFKFAPACVINDIVRFDNPNRRYGLPEYWRGKRIVIVPWISPVEYLLGRRS